MYNVPAINDGPKYGMGLKTVDLTEKHKLVGPGPGAYSSNKVNGSSKIKNDPSFSIGMAARSDLTNKDNKSIPGPGNYDGLNDSSIKR